MKNKGFTLVELIVAIAILGIITAMAIPGVRKLQQNNNKSKFEEYEKSLEYAAKLYVDEYGYKDSISFTELQNKNLIKDFGQNGITCNDDDTIVVVTKVKDGSSSNTYKDLYKYDAHIKCSKNGTVQYETPEE